MPTTTYTIPTREPDSVVTTWRLRGEEQFIATCVIAERDYEVCSITRDADGEVSYFGRLVYKNGKRGSDTTWQVYLD